MKGFQGGLKTEKPHRKKPKKLQSVSDFFLENYTKTACPLCFQLQQRQPQLSLSRIESKQQQHKALRANIRHRILRSQRIIVQTG